MTIRIKGECVYGGLFPGRTALLDHDSPSKLCPAAALPVRSRAPLPARRTTPPGVSASFSLAHPTMAKPIQQTRSSNRPRLPRRRPSPTAPPSSSLLALLASFASAYGSPAPPSFLCPSLDAPPYTQASTSQLPLPTESPNILVARHVPDRYSKQPDGVWRRVGSYTLYGSTMPACTSSCSTPTAAVSPLDDQIQVGDKSDVTTTSSALYDISTDLPPGWKPVKRESRTALILLISLFLALLIGSLIVGSMLWRKRMKARKGHRDVEAEARRRRRRQSEAEVTVEKEMKTKQKIWARATARWRTNARYSARQRRGRRVGSRLPQPAQSTTSLAESSPPSKTSSRRSSITSMGDQSNASASSSLQQPQEAPDHPTHASPPAYLPPHIVVSSENTASASYSGLSTPTEHARSRRPSHSSLMDASQNNTPVSAHVATDDKALLARLATLANAPPEEQSASQSAEAALQVSVPEWEDEALETIAPHLLSLPAAPNPFSAMFPAPPSKERLAAAEFYDYSYAFAEMAIPDLETGPSAPPFEEGDAASTLGGLLPSAPPLFEDEEFAASAAQVQPSAPTWDLVASPSPSPTPAPVATSTPPSPSERRRGQASVSSGEDGARIQQSHDTNADTAASRDRGAPSARCSPVRDSVVLPGYQP